MTTISKQEALELSEGPKGTKERAVAYAKGRNDIPPLLFTHWHDGRSFGGRPTDAALAAMADESSGYDMLTIIGESMLDLHHRLGHMATIEGIVLACETYVNTAHFDTAEEMTEAMAARQAGGPGPNGIEDMEKDFQSNPDSPVTEAVATYIFEWDNDDIHCTSVYRPYKYTDGGSVVWGEPMVFGAFDEEEPVQGPSPLTTLMKAIFKTMGGVG